jgi:ribonuclease VapC
LTLIVDTSAVQAISNDESEADVFSALIRASSAVMSAGTYVEFTRLNAVRGGRGAADAATRLVDRLRIEVVPLDRVQAELARDGAVRFGKGRGAPPAVLNFGDLFAYALAKRLGAPLLFKGDEFGQTDVTPAWRPGA